MRASTTPLMILKSQAGALLDQLPRVFDGDVEGIHDARIATRRIREVLPLINRWDRGDVDTLTDCFKLMGRALGRVRDADVRVALLTYLEAHVPSAAPSLVILRQEEQRARLSAVRKLIKRFERFETEDVLRDIHGRRGRPFQAWRHASADWGPCLRAALAERARAARDAIGRTTRVYFPNRSHATRIALKKFRYAAEIGQATGMGVDDRSIRRLKKGQEILGDLHDRQVLLDTLPRMGTPERADIAGDQVRMIVEALEAECVELHRGYVDRRDRLLQICDEHAELFGGRTGSKPAAAVTAGLLALSSAAYAWSRFVTGPRRVE